MEPLRSDSRSGFAARLLRVSEALANAATRLGVADAMVQEGGEAVGAITSALWLLDDSGEELELLAARGYPPASLHSFGAGSLKERSPLTDALRTRQPVFLPSVAELELRYPEVAARTRAVPFEVAVVCAPLVADGRVLGGVGFNFASSTPLDEDDQALLMLLARSCAQALDRARLSEMVTRREQELRVTNQLLALQIQEVRILARASEVLGTSLDLDTTLRAVAQLTVPAFCDLCVVDLFTPENGSERVVAMHADPSKAELAAAVLPSHFGDTSKAQLLSELTDAQLVELSGGADELERLRELSPRFLLTAPLRARGRTLGLMTFGLTTEGRRFGERHVAMAEELGRRAGTAIDHARLYREAQEAEQRSRRTAERLRILSEATRTFSATQLDLQGLLAAVARSAAEALDGACSICLVPEGRRDQESSVVHETTPGLVAARGDHHVQRALETGECLLVDELEDRRRSMLVAPLRVSGRCLGALVVARESPASLNQDDRALLEDLADRAALAIEGARLYTQARDANRLKDEFLATVSHELRTPLTAILGWAQMLRSRKLVPSALLRAYDSIERNARSQARLIDDLLETSRIITGKLRIDLKDTNLASVLETTLETVRPTAEARGIFLTADFAPLSGTVRGDATRLQQVAWNLLSNALKFTPRDGRVSVSLQEVDGRAELTVTDTGEGVPVEFLPFVFDRFRQADSRPTRQHAGLGLGLAIVRHLVELHGGSVEARSDGPGSGATFRVLLPLSAEQSLAVRAIEGPGPVELAPPLVADHPLAGARILIVDNEADTLALLEELLVQSGARVFTAGSVRGALNLYEETRPDLVLSDIGMPDEDGFTLIRRLRSLPQPCPAVAITAYARAEDRARALSAGFADHVSKPVDAQQLINALVALREGVRPSPHGTH